MTHQERKQIMREQFRTMLKDLGWNQTKAAEELKITRSYVNNILNGRGKPSATLMELLAVKANHCVTPEILKQKARLHREVGEIEKALYQLAPAKREVVLGQVASLIRTFVQETD